MNVGFRQPIVSTLSRNDGHLLLWQFEDMRVTGVDGMMTIILTVTSFSKVNIILKHVGVVIVHKELETKNVNSFLISLFLNQVPMITND